jgi:hypothetical protein
MRRALDKHSRDTNVVASQPLLRRILTEGQQQLRRIMLWRSPAPMHDTPATMVMMNRTIVRMTSTSSRARQKASYS